MTKPSHRIYALGFLNKSAPVIAQDFKARATLLSIYFNLFNKLLHQDPQESVEKVKKDRTISKKERKKQEKLALKKRGEVDDEDNSETQYYFSLLEMAKTCHRSIDLVRTRTK